MVDRDVDVGIKGIKVEGIEQETVLFRNYSTEILIPNTNRIVTRSHHDVFSNLSTLTVLETYTFRFLLGK